MLLPYTGRHCERDSVCSPRTTKPEDLEDATVERGEISRVFSASSGERRRCLPFSSKCLEGFPCPFSVHKVRWFLCPGSWYVESLQSASASNHLRSVRFGTRKFGQESGVRYATA